MVNALAKNHNEKGLSTCKVGLMLFHRYKRSRDAGDLNDAIMKMKSGLKKVARTSPDWANCQFNLGLLHLDRFQDKGDVQHEAAALEGFVNSVDSTESIPLVRLRSVRASINIYKNRGDWQQAVSAADKGTKLLPVICGRYLSWEDQQHAVIQASGLAADACSLSLKIGNVEKAL